MVPVQEGEPVKVSPELEAKILELAGVNPRPAADLSEKAFQADVVKLARMLGWKVYHTFDSRKSQAGYPDLTLVRERVMVAELKVGTNRPTSAQEDWLDAFRAARVPAYLWRPEDWPEIVRVLEEAGRA